MSTSAVDVIKKCEKTILRSKKNRSLDVEKILKKRVLNGLRRFPHFCDQRLQKGLDKLIANSASQFLSERSLSHLEQLLITQFFLQKKIENSLKEGLKDESHLFLKIFSADCYRICIALVHFFSREEDYFSFNQITKELESFIPGLEKIENSSYLWWNAEFSYCFYYFEIQKTRGKTLGPRELRDIEKRLHGKLLHTSASPAVFYPHNTEETYRQLLMLEKEISHNGDLPQVSIHFQCKTHAYLEFLIYLVCSKKNASFLKSSRQFPSNVHIITHLQQTKKSSRPIEFTVLSMQLPVDPFLENNVINLVHARRLVSRYLEDLVGPFRDYNGGLFEVQQKHFEDIKIHLSEKIPSFSVFAQKLFYSIEPIETQLSLSLEVVEDLFSLFSQALECKQETEIVKKNISILKLRKPSSKLKDRKAAYAYLELSGFYYYCSINKSNNNKKISKENSIPTLRLHFLEGPPVSLNPWCIYGEIRCRFLCKALYEGLTRIDLQGNPCLAGAESVQQSTDGLVYFFEIRGQRWSNGEKVTAFHYERSWKQALLAEDIPSDHFFILKNAQKIKEKKLSIDFLGVKAMDEKTLRIELERSDDYFLEKLSHPLFSPILAPSQEPKHFNGPYVLLSKSENELVLENNPYYWDRKNIFFNQIRIEWGKNAHEIHQAFLDKAIDWIGTPFSCFPIELLNSLQERGELRKKTVLRSLWVYFNTTHPLFSSPIIRHALHAVLDKPFINSSIFPNDLLLPGFLPIGISSCSLKLELNQLSLLQEIFRNEVEKLGINQKKMTAINLSYCSIPGHTELARYLKETWEKTFGIPIVLQGMDWNLLCSQLTRRNFDLVQCTESAFSRDPLELLQRFEDKNSPHNYMGWSSPAFQEKIISIRNSLSSPERELFLREAEECMHNESPFIPIVNRQFLYATHSSLTDYVIDETGCVDFRWAKWKE